MAIQEYKITFKDGTSQHALILGRSSKGTGLSSDTASECRHASALKKSRILSALVHRSGVAPTRRLPESPIKDRH